MTDKEFKGMKEGDTVWDKIEGCEYTIYEACENGDLLIKKTKYRKITSEDRIQYEIARLR